MASPVPVPSSDSEPSAPVSISSSSLGDRHGRGADEPAGSEGDCVGAGSEGETPRLPDGVTPQRGARCAD
eukprot:4006105-Alexandrium_andersonii.AAC.1